VANNLNITPDFLSVEKRKKFNDEIPLENVSQPDKKTISL